MMYTNSPNFTNVMKRANVDRKAPYQVLIASIDNQSETLTTNDDSKATNIRFPMVSDNAWMRSMPSAGIRAVVSYSVSRHRLEVIGYENNRSKEDIDAYNQGTGLYRPLLEGEHEIMSSGRATTFWGSQPVLVSRAASVSQRLDGIKLEASTRAPTFIWRGHRNRPDMIGHEMRIGSIKRPISASKEAYALKLGSDPLNSSCIYASEFLLAINADITDAPLVDVRAGEVFDDYLTPGFPMANPRLGTNNLPLRYDAKYFVTLEPGTIPAPQQYTETEIDSLGNVTLTLSKLSIIGLAIKAPLGSILAKCGLDMTLNADGGITLQALGQLTLKSATGIDISTPSTISISGDQGIALKSLAGPISINATQLATVNGATGVKLIGALGETGRPVATQPTDIVTSVPLFIDPTIST